MAGLVVTRLQSDWKPIGLNFPEWTIDHDDMTKDCRYVLDSGYFLIQKIYLWEIETIILLALFFAIFITA